MTISRNRIAVIIVCLLIIAGGFTNFFGLAGYGTGYIIGIILAIGSFIFIFWHVKGIFQKITTFLTSLTIISAFPMYTSSCMGESSFGYFNPFGIESADTNIKFCLDSLVNRPFFGYFLFFDITILMWLIFIYIKCRKYFIPKKAVI